MNRTLLQVSAVQLLRWVELVALECFVEEVDTKLSPTRQAPPTYITIHVTSLDISEHIKTYKETERETEREMSKRETRMIDKQS